MADDQLKAHGATVDLSAAAPDGAPPTEIMLMPAGVVETRPHDGRDPWVNDAAAAVAELTNSLGGDLPIDYDHQGRWARENGKAAPAAGWIKRTFERDGAVWATVEWTKRAAKYIKRREYRFVSPEFEFRERDRKVLAVTGAALTNDPALAELANRALANAGAEADMLLAELRSMLKLHDKADGGSIKGAIRKLQMKAAGVDDDAFASTVVAAAVASGRIEEAQAEWATDFATRAPEDFRTFIEGQKPAKALAAVDAAIRDRRVPEELREWAEATATRDLADFEAYVAAAPVTEAGPDHPETAVANALKTGRIGLDQAEWATDFATRAPEDFRTFIEGQRPAKALAAVDAAIREGRVPPALREWAEATATRDLADFEAYVAAAPSFEHLARSRPTPPVEAKPERAIRIPEGYQAEGTALASAALEIAERDGIDVAAALRKADAKAAA